MARPVSLLPSGGAPYVSVTDGPPATPVNDGSGPPVTLVTSGAPPICLVDATGAVLGGLAFAGNAWAAWDFINNEARYANNYEGVLANTPGWTFTRASTGYAQTSAGVLVPFASGELRRTDKGVLIEGARTNLLLRSQEFSTSPWTSGLLTLTAGAHTAPDGTLTAFSAVPSGSDANLTQDQTTPTVAAHTFSVWMRSLTGANVSLDLRVSRDVPFAAIANTSMTVTPTWQRFSLTATPLDTSLHRWRIGAGSTWSTGEDIAIWGAQLEAASFPSSYIPTTTASATRAADVLTVPVSGIDYPISLFAEWEKNGDDSVNLYQRVIEIGRAAATDQALIYHRAVNNDTKLYAMSGGVAQADLSVGTSSLNTTRKMAARYATNDFTASLGGAAVVSDTSGSVPAAPQNVYFGYQPGGSVTIFGYLRRIAIWTRALTDSELQTVTSG